MKSLVTRLAQGILAAMLACVTVSGAARADGHWQPLTVVELFTSQGCNSCPPADAYLSELAERPGILALSWFVDYWNYLGWTDTFGRHQFTERQRQYNRHLALLGVYTPQLIINGVTQEVGSRRKAIDAKLAEQRTDHPMQIPVSMTERSGEISIHLGAHKTPSPAVVWLIGFKSMAEVAIRSGELKGRTMHYRNVVVSDRQIGSWDGKEQSLAVNARQIIRAGGDSAAVLVQYDGTGPIIGAASVSLLSHGQP